jgi:hypothetical protein
MIPATNDAMREKLFSKPAIERNNFPQIVTCVHEITSVHENIALRQLRNSIMETVGI